MISGDFWVFFGRFALLGGFNDLKNRFNT